VTAGLLYGRSRLALVVVRVVQFASLPFFIVEHS
jgi:hypothetical protein